MAKEIKDLFEPLELIEPFELLSEANSVLEKTIIKCRYPGYICKTGEVEN